MRLSAIFALLTILSLTSFAHADIYSDAASAALEQHNGTIEDFTRLNMADRVQTAINNAVLTGAQALEERGYVDEAKQVRGELTSYYAFALTQFAVDDLGDHTPLSQWLGQVYKNLNDRLGDPVMRLLHLDDINVLNYGLPVASQPGGDRRNGDHWNKIEYSRHFIPLVTVVTYWTSLFACNLSTGAHPAVHKWCSVIAMICRNGMHSSIAPRLSDYVYDKFGGKQDAFDVNFDKINQEYQTKFAQVPRE